MASMEIAAPGSTTTLTTDEWQDTLAQLRATNADLQRRRADAEKDRDLFRDLYGKASAHAGDVSKENNELIERAALAESQARDGLAMVKATCEERIRLLEQEVARWKGQCHVLTERDGRMDDEIRRRAALEPELRAENEQLKNRVDILAEQLAVLQEDYRMLEGLVNGVMKQKVEETSELESKVNVLSSVDTI